MGANGTLKIGIYSSHRSEQTGNLRNKHWELPSGYVNIAIENDH